MKILHLIDEGWDSGLTAYALQIADLLQKSGQDVSLGVLPGKKPEMMAKARGLKTYSISSFWDIRKILKAQSWDVVNVHTGRTHTWTAAAKLSLGQAGANIVLVRTRGDARPLKTNVLFRFLYKKTALVIAASDHVRNQYESGLQLIDEKVRTIYPAVAPDEKAVSLPVSIVGIVGRLDVVKGHSVFLDAAAAVLKEKPQTKFLIAGKEAGVSLRLLQNQVAELGISANVTFLGYVPSAQDFMRTCSFGVIASLGSEEVSRACLEWMGTGRAVIGTLIGCLPELIEPDETGLLVPPGDSGALAEGILRLLRDAALPQKWGESARQKAQTFYSPEIMLSKTLTAYEWAQKQSGTNQRF
jgi:glycosyltransferase involved in cell wall biosynthesis